MRNKLAFALFVVMLALFALGVYLGVLSVSNNEDYSAKVLAQRTETTGTIAAKRGDILDRTGTVIATSEQQYIMVIDPYVFLASVEVNQTRTLDTLASYFGIDTTALMERINTNSRSNYMRYLENGSVRYFTYDEMTGFEAVEAELKTVAAQNKKEGKEATGVVSGVWFELAYTRTYPFADSACKVIGFSTTDESEGLWGIEATYDDELAGEDGRYVSYMNDDYDMETTNYDAEDGNTIVSTIDMSAQAILEANIDVFMEQTGGANVGVILMDPNNGEILAMASNKRYDLNNPNDISAYYSEEEQATWNEEDMATIQQYYIGNDEERAAEVAAMTDEEKRVLRNTLWKNLIWKNFCLNDSYEPGSTAKSITISAGLEENILKGDESYYCQGYEMRGGWMIHCNHRDGHGLLTLNGALDFSCNCALMQIGSAIGSEIMCKYLNLFGYGQLTGIDLPGEASCAGLLYTVDEMGESELATTSFGQSYNITMIQQAAAYASIINGGYYYKPHVVKEIRNADGDVVETIEPTLVRQTISEETSSYMRGMLLDVVENGTGNLAKIEGYEIGGKTGASEKLPRGTGDYVVSFISYTSPENPELLLYVVIDTPNIEDQSSSAQAQYLAKACWTDLLPYYNIFPDTSLDTDGDGEVGVEDHNPYTDDHYENGIIDEDPSEEEIAEAEAEAAAGEAAREAAGEATGSDTAADAAAVDEAAAAEAAAAEAAAAEAAAEAAAAEAAAAEAAAAEAAAE